MRKLLFTIVVALATICAKAQITWNVKAGAGLSFITGVNDEYGSNKGKMVWKAGFGAEIPVSGNFMVMPSLEYAQKGMKWESDKTADEYLKNDVHINYLQLPILGAYRVNIGAANMTMKLGPYFAYGFSGKFKEDEIFNGSTYHEEIDIFDEGGKHFDVGGIVGVDFEYHRVVLGVEYERGFTKLMEDTKAYNSSLYITLGYKFTL